MIKPGDIVVRDRQRGGGHVRRKTANTTGAIVGIATKFIERPGEWDDLVVVCCQLAGEVRRELVYPVYRPTR
jgi:hypothetical protein